MKKWVLLRCGNGPNYCCLVEGWPRVSRTHTAEELEVARLGRSGGGGPAVRTAGEAWGSRPVGTMCRGQRHRPPPDCIPRHTCKENGGSNGRVEAACRVQARPLLHPPAAAAECSAGSTGGRVALPHAAAARALTAGSWRRWLGRPYRSAAPGPAGSEQEGASAQPLQATERVVTAGAWQMLEPASMCGPLPPPLPATAPAHLHTCAGRVCSQALRALGAALGVSWVASHAVLDAALSTASAISHKAFAALCAFRRALRAAGAGGAGAGLASPAADGRPAVGAAHALAGGQVVARRHLDRAGQAVGAALRQQVGKARTGGSACSGVQQARTQPASATAPECARTPQKPRGLWQGCAPARTPRCRPGSSRPRTCRTRPHCRTPCSCWGTGWAGCCRPPSCSQTPPPRTPRRRSGTGGTRRGRAGRRRKSPHMRPSLQRSTRTACVGGNGSRQRT